MLPITTSRKISDFQHRRRKELCECRVPCDSILMFVHGESVIELCEKEASIFCYGVLQQVGTIVKKNKYRGNIWTDVQIIELKNYVNSFPKGQKLPYGALSHFAKANDKTREQVKQKITYLKTIGELDFLRNL